MPLTELPVYPRLAAHRDALEGVHMRQLFADDPGRSRAYFTLARVTAVTAAKGYTQKGYK